MAVPFDALSNAFQAELELVATLPDPVGSTFDALEDFLNQQLADLGEPLTTPQTTAMIHLLLDCASLPSARRDSMIRRLLDARGALTPSTQTAAPRVGLQSDLFFQRRLLAEQWEQLLRMFGSWQDIMQTLVNFSVAQGVHHPTETTQLHIVAMTILICNKEHMESHMRIDANEAYQKLQVLKQMYNNARQIRPDNAPQIFGQLRVYPHTVEEFETELPALFSFCFPDATRRPVPCPLDEMVLNQVRMRLPSRRSNKSLNSIQVGGAHCVQNPQQMLQMFMRQMSSAIAPEIPIQILREPRAPRGGVPALLDNAQPRVPIGETGIDEPTDGAAASVGTGGVLALTQGTSNAGGGDGPKSAAERASNLAKYLPGPRSKQPVARRATLRKKPAASEKMLKKPAGSRGSVPPKLILGCSKCRFAKNGCGTCRDPSFRGKRGSR